MIREYFATLVDFNKALTKHNPPAHSLIRDRYVHVRTPLSLAKDTAELLKHIYDQAPTGEKSDTLADAASVALMIAGLALVASDKGLRAYLLSKDKSAFELPPRPPAGDKGVKRPFRATIKLEPHTWSLSKVMEDDMGMPPDSSLRYGFAILRAAKDNPRLNLKLVDARGKSTKVTPLGPNIDLSS